MGNLIKRRQCNENKIVQAKKHRPLIGENLTRNILIAVFALACVVSARDMTVSSGQNVLGVLQESVENEWDENLGRLVYTGSTFSQAVSVFSATTNNIRLFQPCDSHVCDVFSQSSPYIVYQPADSVYCASTCEVTGISRLGSNQTYIIRTYCENGVECLYYGLSQCLVKEGDVLNALTPLGSCGENPLVFEVRRHGVAVNASDLFVTPQAQ